MPNMMEYLLTAFRLSINRVLILVDGRSSKNRTIESIIDTLDELFKAVAI